jgi:hypothetical protein
LEEGQEINFASPVPLINWSQSSDEVVEMR